MRQWLLALILALHPLTGWSQTLPALYSVVNVEEDGVLSVHERPDTGSPALTTLDWNARDIEVVAFDDSGEWAQINIGETTAWISMAYLEEQFMAGSSLLPRPLVCFGNGPFWTLEIGNKPFAELDWLDGITLRFSGLYTISSDSREGRYMMIAENTGRSLHGFVERKSCSDGMSERNYALDLNLLIRDGDQTRYFAGCCSIAP